MIFDKDQHVITPLGSGVVVYALYNPPDYTEVAAYSVMVFSKFEASLLPPYPNYHGTIFPAEQVKPEISQSEIAAHMSKL
jgi:hypothetical protein